MAQLLEFSESYRRRMPSRLAVPEQGAQLVDLTQARARIYRCKRMQDYVACYVEMEAACAELMKQRRCSFIFSEEPAKRAAADFRIETASVSRFLMKLGNEEDGLTWLRTIERINDTVRREISSLPFMPSRYTKQMGDTFNKIEVCLIRLRSLLSTLILPHDLRLPPPAYL